VAKFRKSKVLMVLISGKMVYFETSDFDFSFRVNETENVAIVSHFYISPQNRGNNYGSILIEALKRIAFETHDVDKLSVSIGGGEKTVNFLEKNGFEVVNKREYSGNAKRHIEGDYGVDAIYKREWISDDYS